MVMHAALAVQRIQLLARGAPCILLGDFNFKPGDAAYRLVTRGQLEITDAAFPVVPEWERWAPTVDSPMQSAYALATGQEPEFTNHTVRASLL